MTDQFVDVNKMVPITPPPELEPGWQMAAAGPTRDEAVAFYSEVMAVHNCQTLGDMAEHFARAILAKWGKQ